MTSPEKLATPDSVMVLALKYGNALLGCSASDTRELREALRAEVTRLDAQRQGEGENRKIAQLIIDNDRAGAVKWATGLIGNFDGPSCRIDPDATSQGVAVAQPDKLREAVILAYGHLWHVNNEPAAPIPMRSPEKAAYEARKVLRDLLTSEERGDGINKVGQLIGRYDAATTSKD